MNIQSHQQIWVRKDSRTRLYCSRLPAHILATIHSSFPVLWLQMAKSFISFLQYSFHQQHSMISIPGRSQSLIPHPPSVPISMLYGDKQEPPNALQILRRNMLFTSCHREVLGHRLPMPMCSAHTIPMA